jgi:hypothetical protein
MKRYEITIVTGYTHEVMADGFFVDRGVLVFFKDPVACKLYNVRAYAKDQWKRVVEVRCA